VSCPVGNGIYFFGFRGACARSDAIGPRSRFGVFGLRKSFPACDASLLDVVILFPFLHVVEIRPIGIRAIVPEVREELRKQYDSAPLVSLMVLWMRRSVGKEGKMGVLAFHPVAPGEKAPQEHEYKPWESKAISWYLQRRCPDGPKKS
jgi:hypothetical protein